MPLPILSRLRSRPVELDKDQLLEKAIQVAQRPGDLAALPPGARDQVDQLVKALSVGSGYVNRGRTPGHLAQQKPLPAAVVAARAHQVLGPSSSVTPTDIALALTAQGLDWVEPFAPGTPLTPFYGYGRRPRNYDYKIGRNVTTETREDRIPFVTLERLYLGYDVAQICTRHAINSMRSMMRQGRFEAMDGYEKNPVQEIKEAKKRLRKPDGKRFFPNWLAQNMLNLWKFDSAPIYPLRDRAGNIKRLVNISAKTIAPMLDYFGDFPEGEAPAFQQFIEGVPWDWLTWDQLIYEPFWPETDSPYGTPPLETVLVNANTDVRLQLYFLQFFTAGSVPEAFAIAPEGMTSGDDVADFQELYDAYFQGDQAERYGLKWLPNGTELQFYKPQMFDPDLAEYVMRRTVSAFLETPHNLGFTDQVNRASGDTQMDVQFRVTDLPVAGYYENILDWIIQEEWGLPVQYRFDTGGDKVDRLQEAQAHQLYVQMGAESPDDVAENVLGLVIDPEARIPRAVYDQRLGVIPLSHIIAISGDVDPATGSPRAGSVQPQEYALPNAGTPVPGAGPAAQGGQPPAGGAGPKAPDPTKVYPTSVRPRSNVARKEAPIDARSEGTPGWGQGLASGSPEDEAPGYGVAALDTGLGYGSTAQGTGVRREGDTDAEMVLQAERAELRKWQRNARKAVARGARPRPFADSVLPPGRVAQVWAALEGARTRDEVDAAFKAAGPEAAGVVVQAEDSGRVLLVQRTPDKHDPKEAFARWEFPGGKLDHEGDTPWDGALREFEEETGATLDDFEHVGNWTSPDGVYQGFVVTVPREADLTLHPQPEEVSAARWWHKDDLDDPKVRDKVTETLDRVTPMLKGWAEQPRDHVGRFTTEHAVAYSHYHQHTDAILEHYAPTIAAAMAEVFEPDFLRHVVEVAYGHVAKAANNPSGRGSGLPPNQAAALAAGGAAGAGAAAGAGVGAGVAGVGGAAAGVGAAAAGTLGATGAQVVGAAVGIGAAIALLAGAKRVLRKLRKVLTDLYGEAYMQGAHEAAETSGGEMPPWTNAVPLPEDFGTRWTPGVGREASQIGGGSLSEILRQRDIWIREMTDTEVDRIGEAIRRSVEDGKPLSEAIDLVNSIVHDEKRAWLIAETEYARASTIARRETYRVNGVPYVRWIHQPGACPSCMENAAVSPIPLGAQWPSGSVPVHPRCRCVEAPAFGPRGSR